MSSNEMIKKDGVIFYISWLKPRTVFYVVTTITTIASYELWVLSEFLTGVWEERISDAAAIVNVVDGLTATMSIATTYLTDAYFSSYSMTLVTAAAYSIGLFLLTLSVPPTLSKVTCQEEKAACVGNIQHSLFYIASIGIVIGRSGYANSLTMFWAEQPQPDPSPAKQHCTDFDWISISLLLIVIGTSIIRTSESWQNLFLVLAVLMVTSTLIFLCGTPFYTRGTPCGSPLTPVIRVLLTRPSNANESLNPEKVQLPLHNSSSLKVIEKVSTVTTVVEKRKSRLCTVPEEEETKLLLGMFPLWTTFLTCGLVLSVGNTYFLEQGNDMENKLGTFRVPSGCFLLLSEFSRIVTTKLFDRVISNCSQFDRKSSPVLGIGLGMIVSILCCIVAALVETKRLTVSRNHSSSLNNPNATLPMAILWLTPQFILLGAMGGLVTDGITQFFYHNGPDSLKSYADPLAKSAIGIGTILSAVFVAILNKLSRIGVGHGWFAATLERSHLDYFYWTLACLSFVNLIFYSFMARRYTIKRGRSGVVVPVHLEIFPVRPDVSMSFD